MSGALVFTHGAPAFVATTKGTTLNFLALEAREACIPGSHGTGTIRETVPGRLPLPGCCTDSKLKHTPSISEKEAYLLV